MKKKELKKWQLPLNFFNKEKKNYSKATFRLSVVGFIGSIGFYIGVLRDLGADPVNKDQQIELLEKENERLENHIDLLIENA